ncbi:MAG: sulfotransferase [Alphaproteobacteria bacterium]|nr:sulfotransferase [Alphaproteobacteria bacterium]MCB9929304.1 sulfotransferase [Alphaproteobacteria bacterium]
MPKNTSEPLSSRMALVVGAGRSGTSFLTKILDASPEVLYRHEPDISRPNSRIPYTPSAADIERYRDEARSYFAALTRQSDERASGSRPVFRKAFRSTLGNAMMPGWVYGAKALGKAGIIFHVPDMIARKEPPFVVIKSVSATMRAPIFANALPNLKIIHIVRHPCAVLASLIRGRAAGKMTGEVFLEALFAIPEAHDYGLTYDELAKASYGEQQAFRWMIRNDFARRHLHGNPNYTFVSYEKLCCEPQAEAERLCAFLGLPMDEQIRDYIRLNTDAPATTDASYFSLIRNTLSALSKWESQISAEDAAAITRIVERSDLGRETIAEYQIQRARLD